MADPIQTPVDPAAQAPVAHLNGHAFNPEAFLKGWEETAKRLQEVEKLRAELASLTYYLLSVIDGEEPELEQFASLDLLAARLRGMASSRLKARVYLFHGERLNISRGLFKYLLAGEQRIPLFESGPLEIDEAGNLTEEPDPDDRPEEEAALPAPPSLTGDEAVTT